MPVRKRRTQEERRTTTIRKLLDAATEELIESGYAGASVQPICERAGVSQGALFRHFATRDALMVAVGEDVAAKLLARYRREFLALRERETPLVLAIRLLREVCRSRINQAWFELAIASRTNATLREALLPTGERYAAAVTELAGQLFPELATALGKSFPVWVDTIVAAFDGEALHRFVLQQPELEDARLELLTSIVLPLSRRR